MQRVASFKTLAQKSASRRIATIKEEPEELPHDEISPMQETSDDPNDPPNKSSDVVQDSDADELLTLDEVYTMIKTNVAGVDPNDIHLEIPKYPLEGITVWFITRSKTLLASARLRIKGSLARDESGNLFVPVLFSNVVAAPEKSSQ